MSAIPTSDRQWRDHPYPLGMREVYSSAVSAMRRMGVRPRSGLEGKLDGHWIPAWFWEVLTALNRFQADSYPLLAVEILNAVQTKRLVAGRHRYVADYPDRERYVQLLSVLALGDLVAAHQWALAQPLLDQDEEPRE
jgi:hypothetical protein